MYYHGPKDFAPLDAHCDRFNSCFFYLEPDGTFVYELNEDNPAYKDTNLPMNLSNENDEILFALVEKSAAEGKDLVYEAYKDKAFDPYPDPDCDY